MGVVRLRLQRLGRRHLPFYRIVAADSRSKRDGKHIEILGTYDPIPRDGVKDVRLKVDRVQYWLSVGAQPSNTVGRLLGMSGILPDYPRRLANQESVPKAERGYCTLARCLSSGAPTANARPAAAPLLSSPLSDAAAVSSSTFSFVSSATDRFFHYHAPRTPIATEAALMTPSGTTPLVS
eukprot:g1585.t1